MSAAVRCIENVLITERRPQGSHLCAIRPEGDVMSPMHLGEAAPFCGENGTRVRWPCTAQGVGVKHPENDADVILETTDPDTIGEHLQTLGSENAGKPGVLHVRGDPVIRRWDADDGKEARRHHTTRIGVKLRAVSS
ncbi:hypothetical protein [Sphingosinicella soli]|uniref:Uncharacterized protein n=1 Tax=Sphingosinicella soli TaxID=333708 RepID=A0A7W7F797_9SPHN|nr:hypothetical protein [Sphingosinicella soli]MBB4633425.1 hypothetical protein [Sphingosinicella soli]